MTAHYRKVLLCALFFCSVISRAGNEVGGGGIAENNVAYAYQNLDQFIGLCLSSRVCTLTDRERRLLSDIQTALPAERRTKEPLAFRSASDDPTFFFVDGQVRLARTGFHVGDTIYFNRDLLYPAASVASIPLLPPPDRPLDIPLAVGVLVHELGHHQGERDHTFLDTLGSKVNTALRAYAQELDGGPRARDLIVDAFEFSGPTTSELVLRDGRKILSVGSDLLASLSCPVGAGNPKNFALWNLHWRTDQPLSQNIVSRPLRARAILYCESPGGTRTVDRELDIFLTLRRNDGKLEILKDRIRFQQIDCGKQPQLCH